MHKQSTHFVSVTLKRDEEGRFNVVFRHDSADSSVRVRDVRPTNVNDDRFLLRHDDIVVRVNDIPVRSYGGDAPSLTEVQQLVAQSGAALTLLLERHGNEEVEEQDKVYGQNETMPPGTAPSSLRSLRAVMMRALSFDRAVKKLSRGAASLSGAAAEDESPALPSSTNGRTLERRSTSFDIGARHQSRNDSFVMSNEQSVGRMRGADLEGRPANVGGSPMRSARQGMLLRGSSCTRQTGINDKLMSSSRTSSPHSLGTGPRVHSAQNSNYKEDEEGYSDDDDDDDDEDYGSDGQDDEVDNDGGPRVKPRPARPAAPAEGKFQQSGSPRRTLGQVLERFDAETAVECSVSQGEILVLVFEGAPEGWVWACTPSNAGLVPRDYVQPLNVRDRNIMMMPSPRPAPRIRTPRTPKVTNSGSGVAHSPSSRSRPPSNKKSPPSSRKKLPGSNAASVASLPAAAAEDAIA